MKGNKKKLSEREVRFT